MHLDGTFGTPQLVFHRHLCTECSLSSRMAMRSEILTSWNPRLGPRYDQWKYINKTGCQKLYIQIPPEVLYPKKICLGLVQKRNGQNPQLRNCQSAAFQDMPSYLLAFRFQRHLRCRPFSLRTSRCWPGSGWVLGQCENPQLLVWLVPQSDEVANFKSMKK